MSTPIKFIVNFIIILSVQVFILNDIVIKSSISVMGIPAFIPIIYPLIILLLPVNTPPWLSMLLGFATGICVDMFSNTPGINAASCVLLAYIRPYILTLFFQQSIKELGGTTPTLFQMGLRSFVLYIIISLLFHHFVFYLLQIWSMNSILLIFFKTIISCLLSLILIILSQLIFATKEIKRV